MLSQQEEQIIIFHSSYGNDKLDEWCLEIKNSRNPFFLKASAETYNWNDGMELPKLISTNPSCDLGTALCLFWLAGAMSFYTGENQRNEHNGDWIDFCEGLTDKLINNHFALGAVSYDPRIGRVAAFNYQKAGVPAILFHPVVGHV